MAIILDEEFAKTIDKKFLEAYQQIYKSVNLPFDQKDVTTTENTINVDGSVLTVPKNDTNLFDSLQLDEIRWLKNKVRDIFMSMPLFDGFDTSLKSRTVIAGGVFTSLLNNEIPKDVDVFILGTVPIDQIHLIDEAARQNVKLKMKEKEYLKNNMIVAVYEEQDPPKGTYKYQYIFTKYPDRKHLIDHFDFEHTKISYQGPSHGHKLYMSYNAYIAAKNKLLVASTLKAPEQWRWDKFLGRGFRDENKRIRGVSSFPSS